MRQFTARMPRTYWVPSFAIHPSRTASPPLRWQSSRDKSGVSAVAAGLPISRSDCCIRSSEMRLRVGRLLELDRHGLAQGGVEDRLAGVVGNLAEDDAVSFPAGRPSTRDPGPACLSLETETQGRRERQPAPLPTRQIPRPPICACGLGSAAETPGRLTSESGLLNESDSWASKPLSVQGCGPERL